MEDSQSEIYNILLWSPHAGGFLFENIRYVIRNIHSNEKNRQNRNIAENNRYATYLAY